MRKLAFAALTAGILLVPAAAAAQHAPPSPGARMQGHWQAGPGMHRMRDFRHHRLRHGMRIHPFWFGPQFHVQNWQLYGFHQPAPDHRWVRYYDDAYLIDRGGHVRDMRYGVDWDRYGEPWAQEGGIPRYVGDGDFHPDERDYAWVEDYGPEQGYADYGYPPPQHGGCQPAYQQPCGGYGPGYAWGSYGHGYHYGCCGTVTIVETTVTPTATVRYVTEEVVEERVIEQRPRGRKVQARPVRRTPPPPPPAGERG